MSFFGLLQCKILTTSTIARVAGIIKPWLVMCEAVQRSLFRAAMDSMNDCKCVNLIPRFSFLPLSLSLSHSVGRVGETLGTGLEVCFEFPFNLIDKSTMAFLTGQSWWVLKSWYTVGVSEQGFWCCFVDVTNQGLITSALQATSTCTIDLTVFVISYHNLHGEHHHDDFLKEWSLIIGAKISWLQFGEWIYTIGWQEEEDSKMLLCDKI